MRPRLSPPPMYLARTYYHSDNSGLFPPLKVAQLKAHRNADGERMTPPCYGFGLKFFIRLLSSNCRFVAIRQY